MIIKATTLVIGIWVIAILEVFIFFLLWIINETNSAGFYPG